MKRFFGWLMLALALLGVFGFESSAEAESIKENLGTWDTVQLTIKPLPELTPKARLYMEGQVRLYTDNPAGLNGLDRALLWIGPGYQVTDKFSLYAGYAWTPTYQPKYNNGNRLWQQALYTQPVLHGPAKGGTLMLRGRVEEIFIGGPGNDVTWARALARYAHPFKQGSKNYWLVQNEVQANLYGTSKGARGGFDSNRLMLGVGRALSKNVNLEGGYFNLFTNGHPNDKMSHILFITLNIHP